jgi:hypothetical protein
LGRHPAFIAPPTGVISVWLRVEVWLHLGGTTFRTVLDARGTVVVPPLECCPRPYDLPEGLKLPPALRARVEVTP